MSQIRRIFRAIRNYAGAYGHMENLQKMMPNWLPVGDQKTGVIGEFYAKIYLSSIYPEVEITFGDTDQQGWDLEVKVDPKPTRVQVKTVSEHSKTRRISPIYPGWDKLYLVFLDKGLYPVGFWEIDDASIVPTDGRLANRTMPKPGEPNSGSVVFADRKDRLPELVQAIRSFELTMQ